MKKKLLSGIFALALLAAAAYGMRSQTMKSDSILSDWALMNVEALANGEVIIGVPCMQTCSRCWCYYPPIDVDPNDYWIQGEPYY
ncbi:NVEALA domain-containing protein [Proteiniphilum sp. X52]|uniref:NVEALA domain-containing protein n=1 Tax=Proteiniphilum sp. X52 TaxID=2382159 RepID=UPI000F09DEBE|nr:NVEALA domain-containing protein [Proteiniphilum sp. X52]RNC63493.1 hypothetical protein D7D25_16310 [Proteiniphilum sp. X52]